MDTVPVLRAVVRFVVTVAVAAPVGAVVALAVPMAVDPEPGQMRGAIAVFPDFLKMSAPIVAGGLLLFGLPVDWALRRRGYRRAAAYGAAGALGGGVIGYFTALVLGGYFSRHLAGPFTLFGVDFGLVTAVTFWLVFRRGGTPAAPSA
jgi:hypothetical protein